MTAAGSETPGRGATAGDALSMRDLGKLTREQVSALDHPVPITSNGSPVAWLVPLSPSERRRAEMIAAGQLRPGRDPRLEHWAPMVAKDDEKPLSEILMEMREQERA